MAPPVGALEDRRQVSQMPSTKTDAVRWGNGKRRIVVENTEPPFQDTMPMSKEAASLANAMVGTLESISGGLKKPSSATARVSGCR